MTEHCAIHADYVGIKTLSGRKVVQITCEVALERLEEVIRMLGSPNPSTGKPVALALLSDAEVSVKEEIADKTKRAFTDLPLSQQAALLCKDVRFQKFMKADDENDAAMWLCERHHITSRSQLDRPDLSDIATQFRAIRNNFYANTKQYPEQRG